MSTPDYKLARDRGHKANGMGLYTRRPYHKSELIFTEEPLIRVPYKSSQPFMKQLWRHVANDISSHPIVYAFKSLNRYDQKDFLRLHNARREFLTRADPYPPNIDTDRKISGPTCAFELVGIYLTNLFFLHEDLTGVFKSISRINHACAGNAYLVWDRTNNEMRVVAASNILFPGTEITIDYSEKFVKLGIFMMLEHIREHCRYFYGFWCQCNFCLPRISDGTIQTITPEQEKNMISYYLDELEQRLILKQETPCWKIRELRGGEASFDSESPFTQYGMFAQRRILKGEPIHGEAPMFVLDLHPDQLKGATYIPSVLAAVKNLTPLERLAYLGLCTRDPSLSGFYFGHNTGVLEINQLKEIFVSNAICLPTCCTKEGYCEWGVFEVLSRVNHSCVPNAIGMTYNRKLRGTGQCQYWLHARRDIEPGEQITISYLETLSTEASEKTRAAALKDRFICWCSRCDHDRRGSSWVEDSIRPPDIDYHNENPTDYPNLWVELMKTLPTQGTNQPAIALPTKKGKEKVTLPQLVPGDSFIELNKIPKKEWVLLSAKRTGKRIANRISSLPGNLDNMTRNILISRDQMLELRKKELLQRRIKFPDDLRIDDENGNQITMRGALERGAVIQLGKQRASSGPLPTDWSTMSAIVTRPDSEVETGWGSVGTAYPSGKQKATTWANNLPVRPVGTEPPLVRKDNQPLAGRNRVLAKGFSVIDPASTSTELWESPGGRAKVRVEIMPKQLRSLNSRESMGGSPSSSERIPNRERSLSNQSQITIPLVQLRDSKLSEQYYMSRLGVEPVTAERLERAQSLSLKSPATDDEPTSGKSDNSATGDAGHDHIDTGKEVSGDDTQKTDISPLKIDIADSNIGREEFPKGQSDGAVDNPANDKSLEIERYQSLASSEWSSSSHRKTSTGYTRQTNTPPTELSTEQITKNPANSSKQRSVSSDEQSPFIGEVVPPAIPRERYRGLMFGVDRGALAPRSLCRDPAEERARPRSAGPGIQPGIDGSYSSSRTDRDRRPLSWFEPPGPGRPVHLGPPGTRYSNPTAPAPNNPPQQSESARRASAGSAYTHGIVDRCTTPRVRSQERSVSAGIGSGAVRQATPRPHSSNRQPSTGSISEGHPRDPRTRTQEYERLPSSGKYIRGGLNDNARHSGHHRQQPSAEFSSVNETGFISSDSDSRRSQSRAESSKTARMDSGSPSHSMAEFPVRNDVPEGSEELAQRARNVFDRACANLPRSSLGPVHLYEATHETIGLSLGELESLERDISHPFMIGAVDAEGEITEKSVPSINLKVDTTKLVDLSMKKAPEDDSPQSQHTDTDLHDLPCLMRFSSGQVEITQPSHRRFSLDSDELPNSAITSLIHEGSESPELDLPGNFSAEKGISPQHEPSSSGHKQHLTENNNPRGPRKSIFNDYSGGNE